MERSHITAREELELDGRVVPVVTNTIDIGTSSLQFKDLYIDGSAYIDGFAEDVLFATTKKIQFHDTGVYIHASANGKLKLSADGGGADDITLSGGVTVAGDMSIDANYDFDMSAGSGTFATGTGAVTLAGAVALNAAMTVATTTKIQFRDTGLYINSSTDGQLDLVADGGILLTCAGANKVAVGGTPDFGMTAAKGTVLTGAGYDSAFMAVARCTSADLPDNAYSAGFSQLTVSENQGNAGSWFGQWNELYLVGSSTDMAGAANFAGTYSVIETTGATGSSTDDTDWMAAYGGNVKIGTTGYTNDCQFAGVHVDCDINTGTTNAGNGRFSAFECDKVASGDDWDYGLYAADVVTGIHLPGCTQALDATVACATGDFGVKVVSTLTSGASDGVAAYFEAHVAGTPSGNTFAVGAWMNMDTTPGARHFRALDVGIYAAGQDLSNARLYGVNIEQHLGSGGAPTYAAQFRFNHSGHALDALFDAANAGAVAYSANTSHGSSGGDKVGVIMIDISGTSANPGYIYIYDHPGQ